MEVLSYITQDHQLPALHKTRGWGGGETWDRAPDGLRFLFQRCRDNMEINREPLAVPKMLSSGLLLQQPCEIVR